MRPFEGPQPQEALVEPRLEEMHSRRVSLARGARLREPSVTAEDRALLAEWLEEVEGAMLRLTGKGTFEEAVAEAQRLTSRIDWDAVEESRLADPVWFSDRLLADPRPSPGQIRRLLSAV